MVYAGQMPGERAKQENKKLKNSVCINNNHF